MHWPAEQVELASLPQILLFDPYAIEIASKRRNNPLGSLLMQVLINGPDRLQLLVFEFAKLLNGAEVNKQKQPVAQFVRLDPLLCHFVPMSPIISDSLEILPLTIFCQGEAKFLPLLANNLDSSRLISQALKGLTEPHKLVSFNDLGQFAACLNLLAKRTSPAIYCLLEHSLVMAVACNREL